MIDYLSKERLGIMLTTRCTLRCRGCYLMIPEQKPWDADIETVKASLPKIFEIFDHFDQICLMGGEPFLYRDLEQVLTALRPYLSDIPVEEMKAIVAGWENLPYFSACNYCKGYDPTRTDRIKPAIQLEDAQ